jgi:hypothetical protein
MGAFWSSFLIKLLLKAGEGIVGWLRKKHDEADKKTVDSQQKTIESVNVAVKVEGDIAKEQANVEAKPADVQKPDGTVDVTAWNSGK